MTLGSCFYELTLLLAVVTINGLCGCVAICNSICDSFPCCIIPVKPHSQRVCFPALSHTLQATRGPCGTYLKILSKLLLKILLSLYKAGNILSDCAVKYSSNYFLPLTGQSRGKSFPRVYNHPGADWLKESGRLIKQSVSN